MARPKIHANNAARVAAHRERHDLVQMSVDLPRDVTEGIAAYMKHKDMTKAEVITKLVRSQLLRKR